MSQQEKKQKSVFIDENGKEFELVPKQTNYTNPILGISLLACLVFFVYNGKNQPQNNNDNSTPSAIITTPYYSAPVQSATPSAVVSHIPSIIPPSIPVETKPAANLLESEKSEEEEEIPLIINPPKSKHKKTKLAPKVQQPIVQYSPPPPIQQPIEIQAPTQEKKPTAKEIWDQQQAEGLRKHEEKLKKIQKEREERRNKKSNKDNDGLLILDES